MWLTMAIAKDEPVGVVIAGWTSRLSRIYHWDMEQDVFTPGQFVKARAMVFDISPDGKYVAYYAVAYSKREKSYVAVSHVPYFTAQAFFKQDPNLWCSARFETDLKLEICRRYWGAFNYWWVKGYREIEDRVDPGCPFEIKMVWFRLSPETRFATDEGEDRRFAAVGEDLIELDANGTPIRTLRSFPKEEFEEIAPPDWAQKW